MSAHTRTTSPLKRPRTAAAVAGAGAFALMASAAPAHAEDTYNAEAEWPDHFTSAYTVMAEPGAVVDGDGEPSPGQEGAAGDFMFWVNSDTDVICYDITLTGVSGDYESPAATATHIHDAAEGEAGPPRLAFPDPMPVGEGPRHSSGCMTGPFEAGLEDDDGADHAEGFTLAELEADPAAFAADSHTEQYPDGVVRGQLMQVPVDGVETGGGGTASASGETSAAGFDVSGWGAAGLGALALAGVGGLALQRHLRASS